VPRPRLSSLPALLATAFCFSASAIAYAQSGEADSGGAPVVATDTGPVRGASRPTTITFLGIPFAEPPVGDLRWRPPVPPRRWNGVRDATAFGAHCPQPGSADQPKASEDCLFLNVFVPRQGDSPSRAPLHRESRPVMVWIYGGANASGAAEFYDPTPLVEAGGVVVVTINYRLAALGFLAHPALDGEGHEAVNWFRAVG
jgi:para-nitrobenzyl esterase